MNKRSTLKVVAAATVLAFAGLAQAQQTIKIANIVELSGPGTTAGTLFKNGVELAIKEINEAGGILGKKNREYNGRYTNQSRSCQRLNAKGCR